jgi:pimeloyl-ACP methyl ester carboxylesterase
VLLHGYMATSVMWAPNIAEFSRDHRVYALDVMGQPSKSVPEEPIRDVADYVEWLTATLDGLGLHRVSLLGMSFGGWVALTYAVAAPARVQKLVLLSPGGLLPMVKQFSLRGMLMTFIPTRFTVNSFMRWAGFSDRAGEHDARPVLDLMYLGVKHFRMPQETLRLAANAANPLSDDELTSMHMPVLLLMGDRHARGAVSDERLTVKALEVFIGTRPVLGYFTITFTISWGGTLVAVGGSGGMQGTTPASDPRFAYALIAMLVGPSVTGILLTALVHGRAGLREFRSRLLIWRVGASWYAVALLTAPAVMTATLLALSSFSPAYLPGLFISDEKASLLLISLAVGL